MNIASFAVRHERIFAIALSLAAGIAWFFACNFDKSLTVYHDEVTYTESARDIYNGLSPLLQHLRPSYFSKVFYSYLIAPGFAFSDPTLWQTFLNAVFSGLTVFLPGSARGYLLSPAGFGLPARFLLHYCPYIHMRFMQLLTACFSVRLPLISSFLLHFAGELLMASG